MLRKLLLMGSCLSIMAAFSASATADTWIKQTVDSTAGVGTFTSIAMNSSDMPGISYGGSEGLKYSVWNGSSWDTNIIDGSANVGYKTSLSYINGTDYNIMYHDLNTDTLKHAWWDGTQAQVETVDSSGDAGYGVSSVFDDLMNVLYSSYYYINASNVGMLRFNTWDAATNTWGTPVDLDTSGNAGRETSLALDSNRNPGISYYDAAAKQLKYIKYDGSSWGAAQVIPGGSANYGSFSAMAFDSNNVAHIAYYNAANGTVDYVESDGAGWTSPYTVANVGGGGTEAYISLVIGGDGSTGVGYYDSNTQSLKASVKTNLSWFDQIIDASGSAGKYNNVALNGSGNPVVSYYDATANNLKLATTAAPVPEPSSLLALGGGLTALAGLVRRRRS